MAILEGKRVYQIDYKTIRGQVVEMPPKIIEDVTLNLPEGIRIFEDTTPIFTNLKKVYLKLKENPTYSKNLPSYEKFRRIIRQRGVYPLWYDLKEDPDQSDMVKQTDLKSYILIKEHILH